MLLCIFHTFAKHQDKVSNRLMKNTIRQATGDESSAVYLATLARTDTIVVPRRLVLADEAGLVNTRRRWWRRGAGHHLLRTGALGLHR